MSELKTLASCKPSEFLRQTNRIRKVAEKWLKVTKIMEIRGNRPELEEVDESMDIEDRIAVIDRNKKRVTDQAMKNISKMLDSIMEEHPEETLELLALCCFVEPENVDDHLMSEYLDAFTSLINDKSVMGFFSSLIALVQTNTSKA